MAIYSPYRPYARLSKHALTAALRVPLLRRIVVRDRVVVASSKLAPLQELVRDITGVADVSMALSIGRGGRYSKVTVQCMDPQARILAYAKIPCTEAARARVRHEADVLRALERQPELVGHVPRVLFAGERNGVTVLLATPGPTRSGPPRWGNLHDDFRRRLHAGSVTWRPVSELAQATAARLRSARRYLPEAILGLCGEALELTQAGLGSRVVRCGFSHGDFAPWNTRLGPNGLFAFDWEAADPLAPWCWDRFRFHVQVEGLLRHRAYALPPEIPTESRDLVRALFSIFLVQAVSELVLEEHTDGLTSWFSFFGASLLRLRSPIKAAARGAGVPGARR